MIGALLIWLGSGGSQLNAQGREPAHARPGVQDQPGAHARPGVPDQPEMHAQPDHPAQARPRIVRTYEVPASRQGVAVDARHFYVINNRSITKHLKTNGRLVDRWEDHDSILVHMNDGIILDGKLICVHSNYPDFPMASSLEIFDPETLEHTGNHSFGILNGSATWLDRHDGYWYVAFAHYTGRGSQPGMDNRWTRLVKFDREWRQIESWTFPPGLIERFAGRSNSGGVILEDGRILCTGHDNYEVYLLRFPEKGYTLEWIRTIPVGSYGQGIACERVGDACHLYGIIKRESKVVVTELEHFFD